VELLRTEKDMFDKFNNINIKKIFSHENNILLAYIFGSQLQGKTGPLSDYDFAVFLSRKTSFQFIPKCQSVKTAII